MTDDGRPEGEGLAEGLLRASTMFARSAGRSYGAEAWEVFYLHLATATEQLLKAVLAQSNPLFIADPRGSFDSMLHLAGMGDRAATPAAVVRTITVGEAMARINRLVPGYSGPGPEVQLLLEARNGVVHAGSNERGQVDAVFAETARFIEQLLPSLGATPESYWADLIDLVRAHTQRRLTALEGAYQRKMQFARDRFATLLETLEDDGLDAYRAAMEPTGHSNDYSEFPVACPACESTGAVFGLARPEWEADWDLADGAPYAADAYVDAIVLDQPAFQCRVCGLYLPGTMLDLADLPATFSHRDSFDTSEASDYFTQQLAEDYWEGP